MIKLSQCMIVKNEESNIEKALSWAKGIAFEQIVVDTGSTDRTVEIAEKMGAKVYHFEWNDDFAAAKNYAISKATGDWIAFLDADEYFNEEDVKKLLPYLEKLQNTKYMAVTTSLLNLDDTGNVFTSLRKTRVFRNKSGLQYYGAIHEDLSLNNKNMQLLSFDASSELAIFHTGYAQIVCEEKKKGERNIRILLKELEKTPKNRDLMGYLGDAYVADNHFEEAKKWFEKSIESLNFPIQTYDIRTSMNFTNLMKLLFNDREFEKLLEVYEQAIFIVPQEPDFDYLVGFYWIMEQNDFEKGIFYLENAFQKLEANQGNLYGQTLLGELQRAWEMRATCYYKLQNWAKCMESCISLLKADIYQFSITVMLLEIFHKDEAKGGASAREVLQFLANLYSLQSLKDKMYLLRVAADIQYESLVQEIRKLFTPEELVALDSSMGN